MQWPSELGALKHKQIKKKKNPQFDITGANIWKKKLQKEKPQPNITIMQFKYQNAANSTDDNGNETLEFF